MPSSPIPEPEPSLPTKTEALAWVAEFRRCLFPTFLRRLLVWRGLDPVDHPDLIDDLEQELYLDCLQNGEINRTLPKTDRHSRWLQLLDRCIYRMHVRNRRTHVEGIEFDHLCDPPAGREDSTDDPIDAWGEELPERNRRFLRRLQSDATYLKNGRINCLRSARTLEIPVGALKHAWGDTASRLGFGASHTNYWRRRLVEALLGLGADLLRDAGAVALHREPLRRRPDPFGRVQRIRTIADHLSLLPVPRDCKEVLVHYRRGRLQRRPSAIFADALALDPWSADAWLWMFEAAIVEADFRTAARAVRHARRDADPVRTLLCRARLLQDRGRIHGARFLLDLAIASGHAHDERLVEARQAVTQPVA